MGFFKDLFYKMVLPYDKEAFEGNDKGVIGETARWFCLAYHSSVNSNDERWEDLRNSKIEGLEDLMDFQISTRYSAEYSPMPDPIIEEKFRSLDNAQFGAYGFLLNLFKLEIDPDELKKIDISLVVMILGRNFEDNALPEFVVKGKSLNNWDIIEVVRSNGW